MAFGGVMLTKDQLNTLIGDWLLSASPVYNACAMVERLAVDDRGSVNEALALTTFGYISTDLDRAAWTVLGYIIALALTCVLIPAFTNRRGGAAPVVGEIDARLCDLDRDHDRDPRDHQDRAGNDSVTRVSADRIGSIDSLQNFRSISDVYQHASGGGRGGDEVEAGPRTSCVNLDADLDTDVDGGFGAREHGVHRSVVNELVAAVDTMLEKHKRLHLAVSPPRVTSLSKHDDMGITARSSPSPPPPAPSSLPAAASTVATTATAAAAITSSSTKTTSSTNAVPVATEAAEITTRSEVTTVSAGDFDELSTVYGFNGFDQDAL
jgi:hypothetical protein